MVSSTEMPKATLKTKMVDGLMGMPVHPITPAVNNSGSRFGIKAMPTILALLNNRAMTTAMTRMASVMEMAKFFTK